MSTWLSQRARARTALAPQAASELPIPTQVVSNGEYEPPAQTQAQHHVEVVLAECAERAARPGPAGVLRTSGGMAAAFLALNQVFGPLFRVSEAEAADPAVCSARSRGLEGQFIFDVQTHFLHDDYNFPFMKATRAAAHRWCESVPVTDDFRLYQFGNYLQGVFADSDTDLTLLSGAPSETPGREALSNAAMARAQEIINRSRARSACSRTRWSSRREAIPAGWTMSTRPSNSTSQTVGKATPSAIR